MTQRKENIDMTIKMRLDTQSLRDLLASNPELEVEIGQEVTNNIKDDIIKRGIDAKVEACLQGMMENTGSYYSPRWVAKDPKIKAAIKAAIDAEVRAELSETIKAIVTEVVGSQMRVERDFLTRDMKALMKELVTPEMARDILREKILL
jgi:hypothetical protein